MGKPGTFPVGGTLLGGLRQANILFTSAPHLPYEKTGLCLPYRIVVRIREVMHVELFEIKLYYSASLP